MTSLNQVYTVGEQIAEAVRLHRQVSRKEAWNLTIEEMRDVAIPAPEMRIRSYPHEMSGGMRQRVMIAMALACNPELLIADEPTTALDVTIQAQILDLLRELRERRNLGLLLITHDLGVVAETADRVAVMYAGQIIEEGNVYDVFERPSHPYTRGLLKAVPRLHGGRPASGSKRSKLETIEGTVPSPREWPHGCRFAPRCDYVEPECEMASIQLCEIETNHETRCRRAHEI